MLYCRKCGAPVITDESLLQTVIDRMNDAMDRADRSRNYKVRVAALAEAAEYRSIYKSLMHNITQKEYAESTAPIVLKQLNIAIRERGLMTDEEIGEIYETAKDVARAKREAAQREIERMYGNFKTMSNRAGSDPTADAAIASMDRH